MTPEQLLSARRAEILDVAASHGAHNVRVFGSYARGETTEESDVDLLVDFDPEHGLLDRVALIGDLEELLGGDRRGHRVGHLLAATPEDRARGGSAVSRDQRVYLAQILEAAERTLDQLEREIAGEADLDC